MVVSQQFFAQPDTCHCIRHPIISANVLADLVIDHAAADDDGKG
jgi:hypothetical protein